MSSTNKTSLGLNMWEASDKPMRQDFVNDNSIIDDKVTQLNSNLDNVNSNLNVLKGTIDSISSDVTGIKPVTNRVATSVADNTDYDTLNQPGWYSIYSTVHAPANNLGRVLLRVESIYINGNWFTTQKAIEWYSVGAIQAKIYERWVVNINGAYSWTSWIQTA